MSVLGSSINSSKKISKTDMLFYALVVLFVVSLIFHKDIANIWANREAHIQTLHKKYSQYVKKGNNNKKAIAQAGKNFRQNATKTYGIGYTFDKPDTNVPLGLPERNKPQPSAVISIDNSSDLDTKEPMPNSKLESDKNISKKELDDYSLTTPSQATKLLSEMLSKKDYNLKKLKAILTKKPDVNAKTDSDTIFVDSIKQGAPVEFVEMLIKNGGDLTYKSYDRRDLLTETAMWTSNPKLVALLEQNGLKCKQSSPNNENHLMIAARSQDNADVVEEFARICGLNAKNIYDENVLFYALKKSSDSSVKPFIRLVEMGASVNVKDNIYTTTLLIRAAEHGFPLEVFESLIMAGANVNDRGGDGNGNALHYVAGINDASIVKLLVAAKIDINLKNNKGYTPLAEAVKNNKSKEIIKVMLDSGATMNFSTKSETLAILMAKNIQDIDTVRLLLERGLDINSQPEYGNSTALMIAIMKNNSEIIRVILEAKNIDINLKDEKEQTALAYAVSQGKDLDEIIKPLVEKGSNINSINNNKRSILEVAINSRVNIDVLQYLLDQGAKSNKENALLYAMHLDSNAPTVILLIDSGVDLKTTDRSGYTPLARAISESYNIEVIKKMIDKGADVNYKLPSGISMLDLAKSKYSSTDEMVSMLINFGAK